MSVGLAVGVEAGTAPRALKICQRGAAADFLAARDARRVRGLADVAVYPSAQRVSLGIGRKTQNEKRVIGDDPFDSGKTTFAANKRSGERLAQR